MSLRVTKETGKSSHCAGIRTSHFVSNMRYKEVLNYTAVFLKKLTVA